MLSNLRSAELQKILDHELTTGNHIAGQEPGWDDVHTVIRFKASLDRAFAQTMINKSDGDLVSFINREDPRSGSPEYGIICGGECLIGPL